MRKKLHTFVKVSIKIIPISFSAGPHQKCKPNVNQAPLFLIKIYLLFKKMNERIFTDSFFPESYSDVWIYIIREMYPIFMMYICLLLLP